MKKRTMSPTSRPFATTLNGRALPLTMGLLLLPLGCGGDPTGPLVLQPDALCRDHRPDAIPTFEDATLEDATLDAVNRSEEIDFFGTPLRLTHAHEALTCSLISGLMQLGSSFAHIESLVGSQNLTGLEVLSLDSNLITDISPLSGLTRLYSLSLGDNKITDISPLSGLTRLTWLSLGDNLITDISPLSGLTGLTSLGLANNPISNIEPLLNNTGLGTGDTVALMNTNVSCTDVAALEAKGVFVYSDCP